MGTFGDTSDIISSTVDKIVTTVNEAQDNQCRIWRTGCKT